VGRGKLGRSDQQGEMRVAISVANGENKHAKRIRLDTAEWYRLLDHLAKMRQQETSEIADRVTHAGGAATLGHNRHPRLHASPIFGDRGG
jgi:hypothetical protein